MSLALRDLCASVVTPDVAARNDNHSEGCEILQSVELKSIYFHALEACAPERLVAQGIDFEMPRSVVAIGKCAGRLLDGIGPFDEAFVVVPERGRSTTLVYSDVSSGALADVASGPTISDATTKQEAVAVLERIGGLERIVRPLRDPNCPETVRETPRAHAALIADNDTLTAAAAAIAGPRAVRLPRQIECSVEQAATILLDRAKLLHAGEILVAGGEPTVTVRGHGRGGRCSELAVRVALAADVPFTALFASSDGRDGNTGVGGVMLSLPARLDRRQAERELAESNSLPVAVALGEVLTMPPTGNNLRDLYLLARS